MGSSIDDLVRRAISDYQFEGHGIAPPLLRLVIVPAIATPPYVLEVRRRSISVGREYVVSYANWDEETDLHRIDQLRREGKQKVRFKPTIRERSVMVTNNCDFDRLLHQLTNADATKLPRLAQEGTVTEDGADYYLTLHDDHYVFHEDGPRMLAHIIKPALELESLCSDLVNRDR